MAVTREIGVALFLAIVFGIAASAGAVAFSLGMFAPVSGGQAAAAAVAKVGGYAKEVEFEYNYHTGGHYEVDVLAEGLKHKVIVDASSGQVLGVEQKHKHKRY
ncbi:PepSY domain-containing protein [Neisseria canis]|uniref:PepSY domain-containing protein n=1 Tax=Neisseria canis TaxID=493 RepID=A0A1X3CRE5_9NEIS|nr:PepSY domain-containing protein [Neisseria canis]OSI10162.1 peptidase [Neisseria canis]VEF00344.1 Uncharacterised protein [Neisseria canis]